MQSKSKKVRVESPVTKGTQPNYGFVKMKNEATLDRLPEESARHTHSPEMPLPTDAPELGEVSLGARAISTATNRLYGSF